jgi:glucose/arabinose dehydrogenase
MRILLALLTSAVLALPTFAGTPEPGWTDQPYVTGLSGPTAVAFLPDGRLLITEKGGALRVWDGSSLTTLGTIPVCAQIEMGLLGVAVDPSFASNGFVYLYRTHQGSSPPCGGTGRVNEVVRVTVSGGSFGSLTTLVTGARTDGGNHDGGVLRIGPDGKLYVGVGDTGNGDNVGCPGSASNPYAQDLNALEGKILRINLDGTIPSDNPFFGQAGVRGEIFARGFRNPFRMSFDPPTGNLWVADVGDLAFEEISIVTAGSNYAWPHCEATFPTGCEQPGDIDPFFLYSHGGGCPGEAGVPSLGTCIIGGAFAGSGFGAGLDGHYFFGDCTSSNVYHAVPNGTRNGFTGAPQLIVSGAQTPSDFAFGPDSALYYVAQTGGAVRRVAPEVVGGTDQTLAGTKLSLKVRPSDATKQKLSSLAKDPSVSLGSGNGSGDDPTLNGGSLRVRGATFDETYPLPASAWLYDGKPGANQGYKYRDKKQLNGPIKSVNVKTAKQVKATGNGGALGLVLGSDPSPVDVVLSIGGTRYCMSFGGTTSFAPGKFSAKNALAPASCPP